MANPVLAGMVDSFPDTVNGIENQITQVDEMVSGLLDEKNALIQAMQDVRQSVIDELTPQADYIYYPANFYSGDDGDDASRSIYVSGWRAFNEVTMPVDGTEYYNITTNPPTLEAYSDGTVPPASTWIPHEEVTDTIDTTELDTKSEQFNFITDYIHKPVIEMDGFYGINDKISQMNNAKNNLMKDKAKYSDAISKLGGLI
jgi:hypothetical protein